MFGGGRKAQRNPERRGQLVDVAEYTTADPVGLARELEASPRFRRDSTLGGILHPGRVSFREVAKTDSLHIVIEGNRVSVHIDRFSPLTRPRRDGGCRYSVFAVALHNAGNLAGNLRAVPAEPAAPLEPNGEPETEPVAVDHYGLELAPGCDPDGPAARAFRALSGNGVRPAAGALPPAAVPRVPFSVIDEVVHVLDSESAPWSVQFEIRLRGRLDEDRLREAFGEAMQRHPLARARKIPSYASEHLDYWEIPETPDVDPLRVLECEDGAALEAIRVELQSMSVPLAESPPFRARLVRHPDGDVLMLNMNHAASDAFGCLRLLESVARAYAGADDPLPDIDFLGVRDLKATLAVNPQERIGRILLLLEKLRDVVVAPARIAADGRLPSPGYGFHHWRLSADETAAIIGCDHDGTVNDLLLTALHLAIGQWNEEHGKSCRRISVLLPINLRPEQWYREIVGNFSLPTRVSTSPADRSSPERALAAVTAKTRLRKKASMGSALIEVLGGSPALPLWAKRAMVALLPVTGNRMVDTALLTNLGECAAVDFGGDGGAAAEMWMSAPARMPLGLTLGVVTVDGCIHLAFRYRQALFGGDAARRFADLYVSQLRRLVRAPVLEQQGETGEAAQGG